MTGLSTAELLFLCGTLTLAYTVFGFGGFGANLVALPLMVHVMPLHFAVTMLLVLDLFSASLMGLKNRALIDRGELLRLVPTLLVGMALGVVVLQHAAEHWLLLLLGGFVGCFALWSLFGRPDLRPVSARWAWPAGMAGGIFSSMFGTGGPIYTLYLARRIPDTGHLRATSGALILGSAAVRLLLFTGSGLLRQPGLLPTALAMVPCALVGYLVGSRLHARLPQARVRQVIWVMLLASSASLLWRGISEAGPIQ